MPSVPLSILIVAADVPSRDARWGNGGSLISWELVTRLPSDVTVDLIAFASTPAPVPVAVTARLRQLRILPLRQGPSVYFVPLDPRGAGRAAWQRVTPASRAAVAAASERVDVTVLHGTQVLGLAPAVTGPLVVNEIDPWSLHVRQEAAAATGVRRIWLTELARRTARIERVATHRATGHVLVNPRDAERLTAILGRRVDAVSNGVLNGPPVLAEPPPVGAPMTLGFVGSLDYPPNREAATVLARDVLPRVRERVHGVRLVVAGRQPPPAVLALGDLADVDVVGDFPDLAQLLGRLHLAVFPDQRGYGVRNSVRDAIAHGVPIVAEPSAARGLEAGPHLHVVRGGTLPLAEAVSDLLTAPGALARARTAARDAASQLPHWDDVVACYLDIFRAAAQVPDAIA